MIFFTGNNYVLRAKQALSGKRAEKLEGQTYFVYFSKGKNASQQALLIHKPTGVVMMLHENALEADEDSLRRKAQKMLKDVHFSDSIQNIEINEFASGLLKHSLHQKDLYLVEMSGKYFERADVTLYDGDKTLEFVCYECLGSDLIEL